MPEYLFQRCDVGSMYRKPATLSVHTIAPLVAINRQGLVPREPIPSLRFGLRLIPPMSLYEKLTVIIRSIVFFIPCQVGRVKKIVRAPYGLVQAIRVEKPNARG